ncbi:antibiotic biosynthesis monooxygenase [Limimaricola pyoseonensis]|uniref:ABM domain-containing protein n=1 Tax=Limimaricola pyoseonensis TaxID=521013 RepID=A0A1G7AVS3_9RHOB|nr:antibiotic biosynthesis monooxygenase [Limimaricola pyoseonensis]SDE18881.1 hypothetical protein SAMN04488567_1129 [Limimaricola pyoseonensis]
MTHRLTALAAAALLALPAAATAQDAPVLAVVTHAVEDYAAWRSAYDGFAEEQEAGGVIMEEVYQDPENPNNVMVLHGFETLEAADAFFSSEALMAAMQEAGVAGQPAIMLVTRAE